MSREHAEVEDLVGVLKSMLHKPKWNSRQTTLCVKCSCLLFPSDSSCPSCRDKAMRELGF